MKHLIGSHQKSRSRLIHWFNLSERQRNAKTKNACAGIKPIPFYRKETMNKITIEKNGVTITIEQDTPITPDIIVGAINSIPAQAAPFVPAYPYVAPYWTPYTPYDWQKPILTCLSGNATTSVATKDVSSLIYDAKIAHANAVAFSFTNN